MNNIKLNKCIINDSILKEAEAYFDDSYKNFLKTKCFYKESIIGRYIGKMYWWKYMSLSHKDGVVFVWSSNYQVGVDFEYIKKRHISILDNFSSWDYKLIWWENWRSFYLLWSMRESVIKNLQISFEDSKKIRIIHCIAIKEKIEYMDFQYILFLSYKSTYLRCYSGYKDREVYSFCIC